MENKEGVSHTILIVDDEPDIRTNLGRAVERAGYKTILAADGQEALRRAAECDLILLDLMMPGINGFEVLTQVRRRFTDRWRPVIIVSAQSDMESTKKGYALEADLYLAKPCSVEDMLAGIRTLISLVPHKNA